MSATATPTAPADALVLTRNQQTGPTVFVEKAMNLVIEWGPRNDPAGEDYQSIPRDLLNHPRFSKVVRQGIVTLENESDDSTAAFEAQSQSFANRQAKDRDTIDRSMDDAPNRDYITEPCIGPATRGDGQCGMDVPVQQQEKGNVPPLCATHRSMQSQYVMVQGDDLDEDGKPVVGWVRSSLDRTALPSQED